MCGILGVISNNQYPFYQEENFSHALSKIFHRGPDFNHITKIGKAIFGHTRLSILDTGESSNQPFFSADKTKVLVFNGEIFNYKSLKNELVSSGIDFFTSGDVEVLMKGLEFHGELFLQKLQGFFSFVYYDSTTNNFLAARDRFGEKPFYYFFEKGKFYFSSELRPLLVLSGNKKLNTTAIQLYHSLNYIPAHFSIIEGISKLLPGTYISGNTNEFYLKKYYSIQGSANNQFSLTNKKVHSQIDELLSSAVDKRLLADVPVGCFLSGGIDSSVIALLASGKNPNLSTFTLGFKNNPQYNETGIAERTAKHLKTNHFSFHLNEDDFLANFDSFFNSIDEPFADSSALNLFMLSKLTSNKVKAVLSGDGADELFGGYNKHRALFKLNKESNHSKTKSYYSTLKNSVALGLINVLPSGRSGFLNNKIRQLKRYLTAQKLSLPERYWYLATIANESQLEKLFSEKQDFSEFETYKGSVMNSINDDFNSILISDFSLVLDGDMLVKTDRMSMAHGLEIRSPFLDHDLVDFVMKIPAEMKLNARNGKLLLRELYQSKLPDQIFSSSKKGFEIPLERWFKNELRHKLKQDWLSDDHIYQQNFFKPEAVLQLREKAISKNPEDSVAKLWAVIVFLQWHKINIQ